MTADLPGARAEPATGDLAVAPGVTGAGPPALAGAVSDGAALVPAGAADDSVPSVELVAAALRADSSDLDSYHRVLSATIGDLLPSGTVEVTRDRSMKDRMAGREGTATSIRVQLGEVTLDLASVRGRLVATSARSVRGVVISRQEITVADWTRQLAEALSRLASESASARDALARLIGSA